MIFILARALIPSWRFFDRIGTELRLEFRVSVSEKWRNALPVPEAGAFPLFINANKNTHLARHAILERFIEEASGLTDPEKVRRLTTHGLLRNLVRGIAGSPRAQFRIFAKYSGATEEQVYVSDPVGKD